MGRDNYLLILSPGHQQEVHGKTPLYAALQRLHSDGGSSLPPVGREGPEETDFDRLDDILLLAFIQGDGPGGSICPSIMSLLRFHLLTDFDCQFEQNLSLCVAHDCQPTLKDHYDPLNDNNPHELSSFSHVSTKLLLVACDLNPH